MAGLREEIYGGARYLATREVLGIALRSLGLLVVVRALGPAAYGAYAGAVAVIVVLTFASQLGIDTYLNRDAEPFDDRRFDEASTLLAVVSVGVAAVALAASFPAERVLAHGMSVPVLRVLLLAIPLNVLWAPAQARLEKRFRFRELTRLELGGDAVLHGVSVGLVLTGLGVWGPVCGYLAWQAWLLVGSHLLAGHVPRPRRVREARAMLSFGVPFSAAQWLSSAEAVVNPLLVGPVAGTAGVGAVALGLRVLETFSFVVRLGSRLAVLGFAETRGDVARLRRGLEEAVLVQVVALGVVLSTVALALRVLAGPVLGDEWELVLDGFPALAASFLLASAFSAQQLYLQIYAGVRRVVVVHAVKLGVLAAATALLAPGLGAAAFGVASVISAANYGLVHRPVQRETGYRIEVPFAWLGAFAGLLFLGSLPVPWSLLALIPAAVVAALPWAREPVLALVRRGGTLRAREPSRP